jgi:2-polyprenyl-6-methoxyphenol hydroxylase-like FAD-dependent oxidoreductase
MSEFRFGISGDAKTTVDIPVLIIGGGPVGLALAGDLGSRGVRCMLVEETDGFAGNPRASALNSRSMEFMRRWGITDAVRAAGVPEGSPHSALYCTSLGGYRLAGLELPRHSGPGPTAIGPEPAQRCNQLWFGPILRDWAASFRDTRIHFRWCVEKVEQRSECVLIDIADLAARERRRIAAQIVIDCSGGDSMVRSSLGIPMIGADAIDHITSIYLRIPDLESQHGMGTAGLIEFVDETGVWRSLVQLDGRDLYRLDIRSKEQWENAEAIDASALLADVAGMDVTHNVLSVARWTARNVIAKRYGEGRILMAGDAAHQIHPASDLGLDTGLGDAFDLGWKIEATLAGWASSGLLDSYEAERRPIAERNAAHATASLERVRSLQSHRDIALDTPSGRAARKQMTADLESGRHASHVTDALALGYRYRNSPVIPTGAMPEPPDSTSGYRPTTFPGSRAPHVQLARGTSILDRYGRGFVLLRLGQRAPEPGGIDRAFAHRGVPLAFETIDDPRIAELHERRLVLVRPDGHVAWRGDTPPADPLAVVDRVRGVGG